MFQKYVVGDDMATFREKFRTNKIIQAEKTDIKRLQ